MALLRFKTEMMIPISKDSSYIYSDDKQLLQMNIEYAIEHEKRKIQFDGYTTVGSILEGLGFHPNPETWGMIVHHICAHKCKVNEKTPDVVYVYLPYTYTIMSIPKRKNYND